MFIIFFSLSLFLIPSHDIHVDKLRLHFIWSEPPELMRPVHGEAHHSECDDDGNEGWQSFLEEIWWAEVVTE